MLPATATSVGGDARRLELRAKALEVCVDEKLHEAVEVERRASIRDADVPSTRPRRGRRAPPSRVQRLVDTNVLLPVETDTSESALDELADAVGLPGRDDVVVWLGLLEHEPHRLDVVGGVTPVPAGIEIAERTSLSRPRLIAAAACVTFRVHEVERAARGLVVVEDPGGRVQPVLPAIAPGDEVCIRLRDAVRRDGREWRFLV